MKSGLHGLVESIWYGRSPLAWLLLPLSLIVWLAVQRRIKQRVILKTKTRPSEPFVIVVGNITAGGTGKTPVVKALAKYFSETGRQVGIVLRGYGGDAGDQPQILKGCESAESVGDEALEIWHSTGLPVAVCARRQLAVDALVEAYGCEIVVSDDGLQHYAMPRHMEIAVVDGRRCFGNGWLLPAGPLREPRKRLSQVDCVLINEGDCGVEADHLQVRPSHCRSLEGETNRPLESFQGQTIRAIAAIGNPERFFQSLRAAGLDVLPHPFPDHHAYQAEDLAFNDALPLLMTAKDAVKCRHLPLMDAWVVEAQADLPTSVLERVEAKIAVFES